MRIGICDDDKSWCEFAEKVISDFAEKTELEVKVTTFHSEKELFEYEGCALELLFMDIQMDGRDGIEISGDVNRRWPDCQIAYLTNYLYYATEVYMTEHVFFVLKEQFGDKLGLVMQKVLHKQQQKEKKLFFTEIGQKGISLVPRDVIYIERVKRVTYIHTIWRCYAVWDKISEIMLQLSDTEFLRCHNSYVVYLPAVREMEKDFFIMNDGAKVRISRSYTKAVKSRFLKWALNQIA